jgi:carbamoyl-phosphate synthase large subunit
VQRRFAMPRARDRVGDDQLQPETVSTDYDTSDLLFFEPLTHEDILNICERLNGGPFRTVDRGSLTVGGPSGSEAGPTINSQQSTRNLVKGVIVQFGGQTPLNLARGLHEAGVPLLGTSIDSLDAAGDREQFRTLLQQLGLSSRRTASPQGPEARAIAQQSATRPRPPSFVLGGRAMEFYPTRSASTFYHVPRRRVGGDSPILVDQMPRLRHGVRRGLPRRSPPTAPPAGAIIIGVMEHIEEAGSTPATARALLPAVHAVEGIVAS